MMRARRLTSVPGFLFLSVVLAGYVVYPLSMTMTESLHVNGQFSFANYVQLLGVTNGASIEAVRNSVFVSLLSVLCGAAIGTLLAFVLTQFDFPFRRVLSRLAVLPIALPPLVGVISFLFVFGESGFLPKLLQVLFGLKAVPFYLDGVGAIVAVHAYSFNVYFFLFVSSALRQIDASVFEAAANLGSTPGRTFRRVILPELRPALVGASLLTFMTSMASFSAPFIFGGDRRFMALQIYISKLNGEIGLASAQAIGLALVSILFFIILKVSSPAAGQGMRTKGVSRPGRLRVGKRTRIVLLTAATILLFVELLPVVAIVIISFAQEGSWTWQMLPTMYTMANYGKLFSDPHVFEPFRNSFVMATMTVVGAAIVGIPAAYLVTKSGSRKSRFLLDVVATLPYALPGTVIGLSVILAFNSPTLFSGFTVLTGTFWVLPLAYVIRLFPLVVRSTSASLERLDDSLAEAGEALGAGIGRRLRKIVLPLILPGVVSGSLLVAISALGEFVSSILLYTYSNRPISIEILAQMRAYNFGAAAATSVLLLALIMVLTFLSSLVGRGREREEFSV